MFFLATESPTDFSALTNLGAAGIMGAMWLWERYTSRIREKQIDEAHARILADRLQLDQLMEIVQKNTEAMTRLTTSIEKGDRQ
jgi:hypothetical protein